MKTKGKNFIFKAFQIIILFTSTIAKCSTISSEDMERIKYELNCHKLQLSRELMEELATKSELLRPLIEKKTAEIQNIIPFFGTDAMPKDVKPEKFEYALNHVEELRNELKNHYSLPKNSKRQLAIKYLSNKIEMEDELDGVVTVFNVITNFSIQDMTEKKIIDDVYMIIEKIRQTEEFKQHEINSSTETQMDILCKIKDFAKEVKGYNCNLYSTLYTLIKGCLTEGCIETVENLATKRLYFIICMNALQENHLNIKNGKWFNKHIFSRSDYIGF